MNRFDDFVGYHIHGDGEANATVLRGYAEKNGLDAQERFDLCYFYATTYSIASAVRMTREKDEILNNTRRYAERAKNDLIFVTDRRYVRHLDHLYRMLKDYDEHLRDGAGYWKGRVTSAGRVRIEKAVREAERWYFFSEYSAFLFIEAWMIVNGERGDYGKITWDDGRQARATSGILNVFGEDKKADAFDATRSLAGIESAQVLDIYLDILQREIESRGGSPEAVFVETSLCAYRKFFLGTRYDGYYIDRQESELLKARSRREYGSIADELFEIRAQVFDHKNLGELGGWKGPRRAEKEAARARVMSLER